MIRLLLLQFLFFCLYVFLSRAFLCRNFAPKKDTLLQRYTLIFCVSIFYECVIAPLCSAEKFISLPINKKYIYANSLYILEKHNFFKAFG